MATTDSEPAPLTAAPAEAQEAAPTPPAPPEGGLLALLDDRRGLLLLLGLAAALLLIGLGRFGLWDPQEISKVDAARELASSSLLSIPERHARPPLPLLLLAGGIRLLGTSELAVRLPMALVGLLCLLSVYALGAICRGRRAGFLSAFVLLTVPTFFLGARQATMHLPAVLAQSLTVLGLLQLAAPRPGAGAGSRALGAALAALGLAGGFFSLGAPLGLAAPLLTVAAALALSGASAGASALTAPLLGALGAASLLGPLRLTFAAAQLPAAQRLGLCAALLLAAAALLFVGRRDRSGRLPGAILAVLGAGLLLPLPEPPHGYLSWLGGFLRMPPSRDVQIDSVLKPLGFQLFPWCALLPLALTAALSSQGEGPGAYDAGDDSEACAEERRARLLSLLPLAWFAISYLLATYQGALSQEIPFPALGALAVSAGVYLDRLLGDGRAPGAEAGGRAAGLVAALLCVLVGRDLYLFPEQYGSAHFSDTLRWPAPLAWVSPVLANFGIAFGALLGGAVAACGASAGLQRLRRALLLGTLGAALAASFAAAYGLVPLLSQHVSYRNLFTRYKQLGGAALGVYAVPRSGSKFYDKDSVDLGSIAQVFEFLGKDKQKRAFVLVGAGELAALDQYAKQRGLAYYVIDDSNSQFLLLSSQLPAGEQDKNPLRRLVVAEEPQPQRPLRATFDDKIELLGYDLPAEIARGGDYTVRFYFKVLRPVGGEFKIFFHLEGGGNRLNGDHTPLDGKFPTSYWVPGYYVIDEHRMNASRVGQPAGTYQLFMGLWPGGSGQRLKVTSGPQDGDNRVKLGSVRVK